MPQSKEQDQSQSAAKSTASIKGSHNNESNAPSHPREVSAKSVLGGKSMGSKTMSSQSSDHSFDRARSRKSPAGISRASHSHIRATDREHKTRSIFQQAKEFLGMGEEPVPLDAEKQKEILQNTPTNEVRDAKMEQKPHRNAPTVQDTGKRQEAVQDGKGNTSEMPPDGHELSRAEMRNHISSLQIQLHKKHEEVNMLRHMVTTMEAKLDKAYSQAVQTMAGDVSRDITDDAIRSEVCGFFQGDFLSWCAELCVEQVTESAGARLRILGIMNTSSAYLKSPPYLHFPLYMEDGSSPFLLLQAALSSTLCGAFLKNPYFFSDEHRGLHEFENKLSSVPTAARTDWRVQTIKCLEMAAPYDTRISTTLAQKFEADYSFLLKDLGQPDREDLAKIFTDFAALAIKLWKIRTEIYVEGMSELSEVPFQSNSDKLQIDPSIVLKQDQGLDGRPIALVTTPSIISKPVTSDGLSAPVVWSNAIVWVSNSDPPSGDDMDQS